MNRKPFRKIIAAAALAVAVTTGASVLTATGASALSGYHDGQRVSSDGTVLDVGVNYVGTRSVDVKAVVTDKAGDAYCTQVIVSLWNSNSNQLGNTITLGSVCRGETYAFPLKTINTSAGDIDMVLIGTNKGAGGDALGTSKCYRNSDGFYNGTTWYWDHCR